MLIQYWQKKNNAHRAKPELNFKFFLTIAVAFDMYDVDGDGQISRDEMLSLLTVMVGANVGEEQLVLMAERTIGEADVDGDGRVSFEEFRQVLEGTDVEQKMSIRFLS